MALHKNTRARPCIQKLVALEHKTSQPEIRREPNVGTKNFYNLLSTEIGVEAVKGASHGHCIYVIYKLEKSIS